jgi:hypothetical protein
MERRKWWVSMFFPIIFCPLSFILAPFSKFPSLVSSRLVGVPEMLPQIQHSSRCNFFACAWCHFPVALLCLEPPQYLSKCFLVTIVRLFNQLCSFFDLLHVCFFLILFSRQILDELGTTNAIICVLIPRQTILAILATRQSSHVVGV